MTITNRDELIEAYTNSECAPENETAKFIGELLGLALDWFSEQGFALVSLEPTEKAFYKAYDVSPASLRFRSDFHLGTCIKAANEAGDLLKRRDG